MKSGFGVRSAECRQIGRAQGRLRAPPWLNQYVPSENHAMSSKQCKSIKKAVKLTCKIHFIKFSNRESRHPTAIGTH